MSTTSTAPVTAPAARSARPTRRTPARSTGQFLAGFLGAHLAGILFVLIATDARQNLDPSLLGFGGLSLTFAHPVLVGLIALALVVWRRTRTLGLGAALHTGITLAVAVWMGATFS